LLVLVQFQDQPLVRFELGAPLEVERTAEEHIRWVLADYSTRRLELFRVPPVPGNGVLLKMLSELLMRREPFDPVPFIRPLGDYCNSSFAPLLLQTFLDDPRADVRRAATRALGQMQHEKSVPRFFALLSDSDPEVRREALVALAKRTDAATLSQLQPLAANDAEAARLLSAAHARSAAVRDEDMVRFVSITLEVPEFAADLPALAGPLKPELGLALADPAHSDTQRADAALALGARFAGGPDLVRISTRVCSDPSASLSLRLAVIWMLGRGGPRNRQAVPFLCSLLDSPEPGVAEASIEALGSIGDRDAFGPLLNAHPSHPAQATLAIRRLARPLSDTEYEAFTEAKLEWTALDTYVLREDDSLDTPVAPDSLTPFLRDESVATRRGAGLLLGLLGDPAQAPILRELAIQEQDGLTHRVAAWAARRLRERLPRRSP